MLRGSMFVKFVEGSKNFLRGFILISSVKNQTVV
jgi:hypothetical protein